MTLLIFGAGPSITQYAEVSKLRDTLTDPDGLALHGLSASSIEAVFTLAKQDLTAAIELFQAETRATTPEQRSANSTAAKKRLQEQSGQLPTLEQAGYPTVEPQLDGTFAVTYPNGTRSTQSFPTAREARAAAADFVENHHLDLTRANRERVQRLKQTSDPSSSDSSFAIPPIGPGARPIKEAPKVVSFAQDAPEMPELPSQMRLWFWKNFDSISSTWPKLINTPEGPIAWSKSRTGNKLRFFKDGESARLHFIAAANLPALLENSKLADVHPELKGDRTVAEVHRRYAWADFPDGTGSTTRRHVLLTIDRMSEHAPQAKQDADQAYSAEVRGVEIEILPPIGGDIAKNKSADVVNLKEGGELGSPSDQASTSAQKNDTISDPTIKSGNENSAADNPPSDLDRFRAGLKPEHRHPLDLTRANREMVEHLQGQSQGTGRQFQVVPSRYATLADWAGDSAAKIQQARARVAIMLRQAGHDMGLAHDIDLTTMPIVGMRWNTRQKDGTTTLHAALAEDANPADIIQEHAEGVGAWLLDDARVPEDTMIGWLRQTEAGTRSKFLHEDLRFLPPDLRRQEILEGFSYVAGNNALGKIHDSNLPAPVRNFFRAFKEMLSQNLRIATDFRRLRAEGKVDAHFAHWLDVAAGLDPETKTPAKPKRPANPLVAEPSFAIPPIGPGTREITEAPNVVSLKEGYENLPDQPKELRSWFSDNWNSITSTWPEIIHTPEGPIAWSKRTTGNKLRSFKDGEPAQLHFIAAANLPTLLENSRLAAVEPEAKGDPTVQEVHRRYAWAEFPNGQKRHVLLTIDRMSEKARPEKQTADQAYSSEVLGISLEVLPSPYEGPTGQKNADVVTLQEPHPGTGVGVLADTPTQRDNTISSDGIKPENEKTASSTSGVESRLDAASAALGDGDKLAQFRAGIKPEHQHKPGPGHAQPDVTFSISQDPNSRPPSDGNPPGHNSFPEGENPRPTPKLLPLQPAPYGDKTPISTREWDTVRDDVRNFLLKDFEQNGPVQLPEGSVNYDGSNIHRNNLTAEEKATQYEAAARLRELLENSSPERTETANSGGASHLHHRYAWMTFADGEVRPVAITLKQWAPETGKTGNSISHFEVGPVIDSTNKTPEQAFISGIKPEHQPEGNNPLSVWKKVPATKPSEASLEPDYARATANGITRVEIETILNQGRQLADRMKKDQPKAYGMSAVLIQGAHKTIGFSSLIKPYKISDLHQKVQDALNDISGNKSDTHGRCAEIWAISEMLKAGIDVKGALMLATGIGGQHQGMVRKPCDSCADVLKQLGIRYLESQPTNNSKNNTHD